MLFLWNLTVMIQVIVAAPMITPSGNHLHDNLKTTTYNSIHQASPPRLSSPSASHSMSGLERSITGTYVKPEQSTHDHQGQTHRDYGTHSHPLDLDDLNFDSFDWNLDPMDYGKHATSAEKKEWPLKPYSPRPLDKNILGQQGLRDSKGKGVQSHASSTSYTKYPDLTAQRAELPVEKTKRPQRFTLKQKERRNETRREVKAMKDAGKFIPKKDRLKAATEAVYALPEKDRPSMQKLNVHKWYQKYTDSILNSDPMLSKEKKRGGKKRLELGDPSLLSVDDLIRYKDVVRQREYRDRKKMGIRLRKYRARKIVKDEVSETEKM